MRDVGWCPSRVVYLGSQAITGSPSLQVSKLPFFVKVIGPASRQSENKLMLSLRENSAAIACLNDGTIASNTTRTHDKWLSLNDRFSGRSFDNDRLDCSLMKNFCGSGRRTDSY